MNIQHLSVIVPNKKCANNCPYCVSRMLNHQFENKMDINHPHYDINVKEYLKRMEYVSNTGCETALFTGTSEPQQNKQFLATFALLNQLIKKPFTNLEMQTTGLFLTGNRDYVRFLRNFVGINTIALSVSSLDDECNNEILGHGLKDCNVKLVELCDLLKEYDFNIRICLNLSAPYFDEWLNDWSKYPKLFKYLQTKLHADQVTLRALYTSNEQTEQGKWIADHTLPAGSLQLLSDYLNIFNYLGTNVYGTTLKDVDGMSVFYDKNCIGKHHTKDANDAKHFILAPNCKLYNSWDTKASLVM